jgi:sporulation protein YlmC with PRC-barrel domain
MIAMDNMKHRRLQELDRSDFKIVDDEPDIRGWDVRNSWGHKIGEVEELIVDAESKKVRYMVVDIDDKEIKLNHKKVLIPIGMAELQDDDDDVILPDLQADQLRALPGYDKNHLDDEVERQICNALDLNTTTASRTERTDTQDDFYNNNRFSGTNLYKRRTQQQQPVQQQREPSDYERSLRLWEMRSDGGVIPNADSNYRNRDMSEEDRMEMVRNRRQAYQQRRYGNTDGGDKYYQNQDHAYRKDNSITGRLRNEGLQDKDF